MKSGKFFSVPYDIPHDPRIQLLRDRFGGIVALAYWVTLLSNLYYWDGIIDLTMPGQKSRLMSELELDEDGLDAFLQGCASLGFIDAELLSVGHVVSHGACEELAHRKERSETGKMGGRPKKKGTEKGTRKGTP